MRVRSKTLIMVVLLTFVLAVGTVAAQEPGDPERGGELYVEYCSVCHGVNGQGRVGASLDSFPGIRADAALEQAIREGVEGSTMPAWGEAYGGPLTDEDIDDLRAYITAMLGGTQPVVPAPTYQPPEIEPLPQVEGDPSAGAVVFEENCALCHGEQAQGGFGWPLAKSWPGNQPQVYLRQVTSQGIEGTVMPAWAREEGGPLSQEAIDDVTAYVLSLSPPSLQPTGIPSPQGPLDRPTSLALFAALLALVLVVVVVYYRRS